MVEMAKVFNALRKINKERKANNYIKNMEVIKRSGIEYFQDANRTVLINTKLGTQCRANC